LFLVNTSSAVALFGDVTPQRLATIGAALNVAHVVPTVSPPASG